MNNKFSLDNLEEIMKNNESGGHGFFPVGKNDLWHSGIHLNYTENEGVYPILGGELVAYRLNEEEITCSLSDKISNSTYVDNVSVREKGKEYLQQTLSSLYSEAKGFTRYHECIGNSDKKYLAGSSNYILLRHTLSTKQNDQKYFYSLYMHLSPYGKYLIKNDYCIYLTETKIPKHIPTFNNTKIDGRFYVRYDLMRNKDIEPFYLKWNILLENTKTSVWCLKYKDKDVLPFSNITLKEGEYFKSTFTEESEGLLVTIKDDVRIKSEHIKWTNAEIEVKIMDGKNAFLYINEEDIKSLKPGLFTENQNLTFSFNNLTENRKLKNKKLKIKNKADGTKEKKDSRNIFYIGFVPNVFCDESYEKIQILKNCYLRYPQSIDDNPKDLYRIDSAKKIIYFNKNYVQYPMGSIGYDVYFPTGNVVLETEDDAIVDNSNELVHVSLVKYNIFVYEKDLTDNGDDTFTVNSSLEKPIYIVDNSENFKDLRIYFQNESEEDKTPDYLLSTKDIIFKNGAALLGKTFNGSKGKKREVFTENTGREKLKYIRLEFENLDSKFYLYKDAFKDKRKSVKELSKANNNWELSLEWNDVKKLKDKGLDNKLTAKVFKNEFAETEYFIPNPKKEWTINTVALSDIPKEATEDKTHLVKIYGMKKDKRLHATQEVSVFEATKGEEKYKTLWEEIAKEKETVKCVCVDYQGNEPVYADEEQFELKNSLKGIVKEKNEKSSDYKEIKNSVLCFAADNTNNTPLKLFNLDNLKNEEFKFIPKIQKNKFLELKTAESHFYLYFDNDSLKEDKIFIGNKFDDSYSKNNEFTEKELITIYPNNCLGTAGGFITDKNFIHYSLFTSKEIKKLDFNYDIFEDKGDYYKLEIEKAKKSYKIALPSNSVIFKITNDLSSSSESDKFYEVYIDKLSFYMNENDFQKDDKSTSIKINQNIKFPVYFYENKNAMHFNEGVNNSTSDKSSTPEPLLKMQENFFKNGSLLYGKTIENFENKADTDKGYTNWYKVKIGNPNYKFIVKLGDYLKEDEELKGNINKLELNAKTNTYEINSRKKFELQVYESPDYYKPTKININDENNSVKFPLFERNPIIEDILVKTGNNKYEKRKYYGFCINQERYFVDEKTYNKNKIHRTTLKLEDFFCIHPEAKEKSLACNFKNDFFNLILDNLGNKNGKLADSDIKEIFQAKDFYDKNMDPKDDKTVKVYDSALNYIRSACCTIPLEWDKDLYSDDEYLKFWKDHGFLKEEYKVYQDIMAQTDIKQTLNNCSEFKNLDNYIFYNPAYFLGKLNEWGLLEFNPYEGKTYIEILNLPLDPIMEVDVNIEKVLSNPGMTTLYNPKDDSELKPIEYNGKKYSRVNGFFNAQYKKYHSDYTEYWHEGVDFRGKTGSTIVSLIFGTVLRCGKRPGLKQGFVIIQSSKDENLFYVALHVDHNTLEVKDGESVYPGKELAKTVYLPDNNGVDQSHLHVSVIRLPDGNNTPEGPKGVIRTKENTFPTWGSDHTPNQDIWKNMINPFNYNDLYTWKGRY